MTSESWKSILTNFSTFFERRNDGVYTQNIFCFHGTRQYYIQQCLNLKKKKQLSKSINVRFTHKLKKEAKEIQIQIMHVQLPYPTPANQQNTFQ